MNGYGALSRGLATYTELLACLALARHGYDVGIPLPFGTAWIGFDVLAKLFVAKDYQRLQVKTARAKQGELFVRTLKRKKHNATDVKVPYEGHEFDYLLAVEPISAVIWIVPMADVKGGRELVLSGRTPWIGKDELPKLQEVVALSRILPPTSCPDQYSFLFEPTGAAG